MLAPAVTHFSNLTPPAASTCRATPAGTFLCYAATSASVTCPRNSSSNRNSDRVQNTRQNSYRTYRHFFVLFVSRLLLYCHIPYYSAHTSTGENNIQNGFTRRKISTKLLYRTLIIPTT
ncbi:unnamed protein product, partial [Ectocarpus sp. 12 AP-2014]